MNHTRPDISFAVTSLNQFMNEPYENHLQTAHGFLSYPRNTIEKGLLFTWNGDLSIEVYFDADYVSLVVDMRSTFGYFTFIGGSLITWYSEKHKVVARSSAEAKFHSMAQEDVQLHCDNKLAIATAHIPIQHERAEDIEID